MASLNLSTNGSSIKASYNSVINGAVPSNSPTSALWAVFSVSAPLVNAFQQDSAGKESVLRVQAGDEGELDEMIEEFSEGRIQFAFVKVKDPNSGLPKYALIGWCGEGVPERTKGYFTSHLAAVSKTLQGYHVQISARSDRDLTPQGIIDKVSKASGANYSGGPQASSGSAPPVAKKPMVFGPTSGGSGSNYNPLSRSRQAQKSAESDGDGWGADAPPVTRSEIEKVGTAYTPTKVNMAELTKQKPAPSRFNGGSTNDNADPGDVVRGGYQPIGKVDIAAIRAAAKEKRDDRPTQVKGAYEPVGKVDIAAIRAKAQPREENIPAPRAASPADEEAPKSLAERTAAFSQTSSSGRLDSLPKPKVANKFGGGSNFSGTKPLNPGGFGLTGAPVNLPTSTLGAASSASRTFADEGGMTPAQVWAAKKARERGSSNAGDSGPPPIKSPVAKQPSGGQWESGYKGKTWAPVAINATGRSGAGSIDQQHTGEQDREEETPASPVGGIGAIRDRFKGGAPMGAPASASSMPRDNTGDDAPPPPPPSNTRPTGGVAMPGLPRRQMVEEDEEDDEQAGPNIPAPPAVPRTPTPEPEEEEQPESPIRVAIPVGRNTAPRAMSPPAEKSTPSMPVDVPDEDDLTEEPRGHDPARGAGAAVAVATFGHQQSSSASKGGLRAVAVYDYEKAEDNEIDFAEGEHITDIEQVDPDWWSGTNARGETGLFPSNYVELAEGGAEEEEDVPAPESALPPPPAPAATATKHAKSGPSATALYDYEAAEDNELSFEEGATITGLEFPDEDWWHGTCNGREGLFPSNYVELNQ